MALFYQATLGIEVEMAVPDDTCAEDVLNVDNPNAIDFFENTATAIFIGDVDTGMILSCNSSAEKLIGKPASEIINHHQSLLHPSSQRETIAKIFRESCSEARPFEVETEVLHSSGKTLPVLIVIVRTLFRGREALLGIFTDLSKLKQEEVKLRESEHRYAQLFNNMSNGVAIYYPIDGGEDFIFKDINHAGETLSNVKKEEVLGRPLLDVFPGVKELGLFEVLQRVNNTGEPERVPLKLYQDHRIAQWVENFVFKLPSGEVVAIYEDLTEQKRAEAEKEKLSEQLRQSQKLQSLGQLAGGVAHDFNNLIAGIMGYAELSQLEPGLPENIYSWNQTIFDTCIKAKELISQLMSFARQGKQFSNPVDIHHLIKQVINILVRTLDRAIDVKSDFAADCSVVTGDPTELQNALLNLALNARDAMPEGGQICFSTENCAFDQNDDLKNGSLIPGSYLKLRIIDTGVGVQPDIINKIFDPFFTTKPEGEGTGLGLAGVFGCVKSHHGHIEVDSDVGKGTVFTIYLPLNEKSSAIDSTSGSIDLTLGEGRIVLVDDEEVIRDVVSMIVEKLGYETRAFATGLEALEFYRENSTEVDLFILDMIMPKMNGLALFKELKKINPDVKAIIASGFMGKERIMNLKKEGVFSCVRKPIRAAEISQLIAEALTCSDNLDFENGEGDEERGK